MRFPFRLRAALFNSSISAGLGNASARQPIFVLAPCATHVSSRLRLDELTADEGWHTPEECVARAESVDAAVVWLSGAEPLRHPQIGSITNAIVASGRHVFLHTSGYGLRQRIHEFRPDSRLFLTLDFARREDAHNRAIGRADAFRRSLESIRAAKLSGFLVAAHIAVNAETNLCEVGELIEFLDGKDVDGFIVSSLGHATGLQAKAHAEAIEDARAMIRFGPWEKFSRLLDKAYAQLSPSRHSTNLQTASENAFEEGD